MTTIDISGCGGIKGLTKYFAESNLRDMDHHTVQIKNPIKPFSGAEPRITLSYAQYPHVINNVVAYADKDGLLLLRATCKALLARVDGEFADHIQMCSDGSALKISARWLGRIPSIRFKGIISLGVSYTPSGTKNETPADRDRMMADMMTRARTPDVWWRVPSSSVEWFNSFMKQVYTIDMDGASLALIVPLAREHQIGKDIYGRDFIDPVPVKLIRMYPDRQGLYAGFVPFTSRWLVHSVQLSDPAAPANMTWLHHAPRIPEGTEQLTIAVHLHPDLPENQSFSGTLAYPSSLKRVSINLDIDLVNGEKRATTNAFNALRLFWVKVFHHFRPGIMFYVCNIHLWDDLEGEFDNGLPLRDWVTLIFGTCWLGIGAAAIDCDDLWMMCHPHLQFLRGPVIFSDEELPMFKVLPNGTILKDDGTPV